VREIVIDTETTGLDLRDGHRIVEVGCVELLDGEATGATWHSYFNPGQPVPAEAVAVHGLTDEKVRAAPMFAKRADEFVVFDGAAALVAHNAAFDLGFLNVELALCGHDPFSRVVDTLELARRKLPRVRQTLDGLCEHFGVPRCARDKHGALLDAQLLAEVYAHLTDRKASQLVFDLASDDAAPAVTVMRRQEPLPPRLSEAELAAHAAFVAELGPRRLVGSHRGRRGIVTRGGIVEGGGTPPSKPNASLGEARRPAGPVSGA
jgi:DNA polymerase-3 subunit epsilon